MCAMGANWGGLRARFRLPKQNCDHLLSRKVRLNLVRLSAALLSCRPQRSSLDVTEGCASGWSVEGLGCRTSAVPKLRSYNYGAAKHCLRPHFSDRPEAGHLWFKLLCKRAWQESESV